ncbi:MAG: M23 family metallopeptidase [Endomicrobium sp.]|jgi:murein DD-endopeptidase MepM/ murein hydrolase activator NlpD|nr:M23 family metallopeptidase [Endomicrobium sp.]
MKYIAKKNLIFYVVVIVGLLMFALIFVTKFSSLKSSNIKATNKKSLEENKIEKVIIQKGDVLALSLNETKLSSEDSSNILRELKKLVNIVKCLPGDFYEIVYDELTGEWTNFHYYPSGMFYYEISKSSQSIITAEKKRFETSIVKYEKEGTIESSLWTAMVSYGIPADVIRAFTDIFAWQMDFLTDTRQGDSFKIVYEIENVKKREKKLSSRVIAAEYKTSSNFYKAFYFKTKNGTEGYFDEKGKSVKSAFLKAPLQSSRISSFFTEKRFHPILKITKPHHGIDYDAPSGTPVSSIGDGIALKAQYSGGFGNLVIIKHANGYETYYGHLSKYAKGIKAGSKVKQGQVIGYVGMTGLATGPHLDFRIKLNGKFFDYLKMKQPPSIALSGEDKINFENNIKDIF